MFFSMQSSEKLYTAAGKQLAKLDLHVRCRFFLQTEEVVY